MRLTSDIYYMKWQKKKSSESIALSLKTKDKNKVSGISEAIGKGFAEDAIIKLRKKLNDFNEFIAFKKSIEKMMLLKTYLINTQETGPTGLINDFTCSHFK